MYKQEREQNEVLAENIVRILKQRKMSQNELARQMGMSPTNVNKWCRGLVAPRNDAIEKMCRVLNVSRAELLSDMTAISNLSVPAAYPLSILGTICAGDGIIAEQSFDGYFFVDNSIRADYCLRIEGDSMRDAGIHHADIAFIRKSYSLKDGSIYAVVFGDDNSATLKQVYQQGDDTLVLCPCNPRYSPIVVDVADALIVGECVGVYHPRV